MAGDWIKMRTDLDDDPAVIAIAESLGAVPDLIVGKLHKLWSWADKHTTGGMAPGITEKWVDRHLDTPGFSRAAVTVGWLAFTATGIAFPKYERYNGESAKSRSSATIRQRVSRKIRDSKNGEERASLPRPFIKHVMERDGYQCVYCGMESSAKVEGGYEPRLSVDHIVPATRKGDGANAIENLATCCRLCNSEKSDRTPEEWDLLPTFLQVGVEYTGGELHVCHNKSVTNASPEKRREEKINKTVSEAREGPSPAVILIYNAYPKHVKPQEAYRAIEKAAKREAHRFENSLAKTTAFLLERTLAYAASEYVRTQLRQYIDHPATWFNAGGYDSDQNEWNRVVGGPSGSSTGRPSADARRAERASHEFPENIKLPTS